MAEAKRFPNACVASPHHLASAAGLSTLAAGGNALDAAVATNLVLGVVAPYMCGYGGDLFALIWDGDIHAYNGSGRSPAGATLDSMRASVEGADVLPAHGPLTVTVPGAIEGWFTLLERFGTLTFGDLSQAAMSYARDGFVPSTAIALHLSALTAAYSADWGEAWRAIYAGIRPGQRLVQPALARTIQVLGNDGPDAYYRGPIGQAIAQTLQRFGSSMTPDDLAAHTGDFLTPLSTTYRGTEIFELPPNTQGVAALEALNIIEELDLGPPESAHRHHVLIEAMKLALADRDAYVTDPDHMTTDAKLLASKAWAADRRDSLDISKASSPVAGRAAVGGTIYLCAADASGMCVSLIQSNYLGFGSGVTVPDWGINLQNRGSYFSLDPDHVNVIAPRKRTMHTLMPGMAFRNGRPAVVFGAMGGDGQAQTHLQFLDRVLDDGADIQGAIDAPRWVISPDDWSVAAESRFSDDVIRALADRGHQMSLVGAYNTGMGHAHAIEVTEHGYAAAFDPRSEGAALGL